MGNSGGGGVREALSGDVTLVWGGASKEKIGEQCSDTGNSNCTGLSPA